MLCVICCPFYKVQTPFSWMATLFFSPLTCVSPAHKVKHINIHYSYLCCLHLTNFLLVHELILTKSQEMSERTQELGVSWFWIMCWGSAKVQTRLGHWDEVRKSMDYEGPFSDGRHCERHRSVSTSLSFEQTFNFNESYFAWSGLLLFELS